MWQVMCIYSDEVYQGYQGFMREASMLSMADGVAWVVDAEYEGAAVWVSLSAGELE